MAIRPAPPRNSLPKKLSGRWGCRPLGRGGWRVRRSEARWCRQAFRCARVQRTEQEQLSTRAVSRRQPTPDYSFIFASAPSAVDSPPGPFAPVLFASPSVLPPGTSVLHSKKLPETTQKPLVLRWRQIVGSNRGAKLDAGSRSACTKLRLGIETYAYSSPAQPLRSPLPAQRKGPHRPAL